MSPSIQTHSPLTVYLDRLSEATPSLPPLDHELGSKHIHSIAPNLIRQSNVGSLDETVEEKPIQHLDTPFKETYDLCKRAKTACNRTKEEEYEREQLMQNLVRILIQNEESQKILELDYDSVSAHADQNPAPSQALEVINDELGKDRIRLTIRNLIRQFSKNKLEDTVEKKMIQPLEISCEEIFHLFERAKTAGNQAKNGRCECEQLMQELVRVLIQDEESQKILKSNDSLVRTRYHQAPDPSQISEEVETQVSKMPVPQIAIQLENLFQFAKIDRQKMHFPDLKQVSRKEGTPTQLDTEIEPSNRGGSVATEESRRAKLIQWLVDTHKGRISLVIFIVTIVCGLLEILSHTVGKRDSNGNTCSS